MVRQLQQDHVDMAACWALARQPLQALAEGLQAVFSVADSALLERFAAMYDQHLQSEGQLIYPAAHVGGWAAAGHGEVNGGEAWGVK